MSNNHPNRHLEAIFSMIALSTLLMMSSNGEVMAQDSSLLTYTNPLYGLEIKYPPDWEAIDNLGNGTETNNILRLIPFYVDIIKSPLYIDIFVDPVDPNLIGLEDYMKRNIEEKKAYGSKIIYSTVTNTSLAGSPAYQFIFTSPQPDFSSKIYKAKETGTIIGDLVYKVLYDGDLNSYSANSEIANKVINSLKVDPTK